MKAQMTTVAIGERVESADAPRRPGGTVGPSWLAKSTCDVTRERPLERVTGIGGIFFKAKDPKKLQR
jgi:hypothetical protein